MEQPPPKRLRGFAAMSPSLRKEIAAKGGASVPAAKRTFSTHKGLAISAGRKGGETSRAAGRKRAG